MRQPQFSQKVTRPCANRIFIKLVIGSPHLGQNFNLIGTI